MLVDLEEASQRLARVAASVAVRTQRHELAGHPALDLVRHDFHIVGSGNVRPLPLGETGLEVAAARSIVRVQLVPALDCQRLAAQLVETGHRPDVGRNVEVFFQHFGRRYHFPQDGAGTHELNAHLPLAADVQQVHPLQNAVLDAGRHRWMHVVFVHAGDVIENIFAVADHAAHAVLDNDSEFVGICRVVRHAIGHRGRQYQAVSVLVLQALSRQCRATGGATN